MSDHTPFFPENLKDYAPWVATRGLNAPYGQCQCGCGNDAPISKVTRHAHGYAAGHPIRFFYGHGNRVRDLMPEPNPGGLCMCGCGQPAPIATTTCISKGLLEGKPSRFIHNHHHNVAPTPEENFWAKVDVRGPNDCWEWQASRNRYGHGRIVWEGRNTSAQRVVYELMVGAIPDGLFVCHHCDNPPCCNPAHLFVGTALDNSRDMVAKNRQQHGARHKGAKLDDAKVAEILSLLRVGESCPAIAKRYGVTEGTIRHIAKGNTWKHILRESGSGVAK